MLSLLLAAASATVQAQSLPTLTRHVREAALTGEAKPIGQLPLDRVMTLDVVLPLRDQAGLDSFLSAVYDPGNPAYRHFLTVPEFTERFGPSQEDYDTLVAFLKANGFTVAGGTRDGMDVLINGPVSAVQTAFHVTMRTYQHPTENRIFYSPDREPAPALPFPLWHISGLDNYSIPKPLLVKKSDYAKAQGIAPEDVVSHATTGSGPAASFLGSDMRAAYYGETVLTGAGQSLGLFEYAGTDLADLNTYFKNVGQTNSVPITLLSTDGTSTSCVYKSGCDDTEQTIDMTQAIGMAPGLSSLVMYVGSLDTAIIGAMTTHNPLPGTIGCSWGWSPVDPSTLDPYFKKMAAQGQTFFAASGDSSTWSSNNNSWPADDANVVAVGGTDLVTASAGGPWLSETAWADSGGGISPNRIPIPSWQQLPGVINSSNKGSTTYRNGPDVSANANFTFYVCADQSGCSANEIGGTSFAAPMWAGYVALANQQLAYKGAARAGFIDPSIYAQNVTSIYDVHFHDITSGTSGSYSAVPGYDLVTGWGSPNGNSLINALARTGQPTFQALSDSEVLVLGINANLWLEQAPFGKVPPARVQVDGEVQTFQPLSSTEAFVLGGNGNLWLEYGPFGTVPPPRVQVDGSVQSFQALSASEVLVLGNNGNLWLEQAPFGKVPPARVQIDGNVQSFHALSASEVLVLGDNGNLWLEQAPFGKVPPARVQVDGNVQSFQALSASQILVLGDNGNLWLEQAPFGKVPPARVQVDGNVQSFHALSATDIFVLGINGNLWLEQAPFGKVPPARVQVDGNVQSFQPLSATQAVVLGNNGNLWLEYGPFGVVPPVRSQIDAHVQ